MSMMVSLFLLFITAPLSGSASLMMSILMFLCEWLHRACLSNIHFHISLFLLEFQCLSDFPHLFRSQAFWELYGEFNKEVSKFVSLFVIWHAESFNGFNIIWFNDFTRIVLYSDFFAIQMGQDKIDSS